MLPLDFANIGQNTKKIATILTFCQNTIIVTFLSSGPFAHTGALNPLVSHRAKFQQLKNCPPPKKKTSADAHEQSHTYTGISRNTYVPCKLNQTTESEVTRRQSVRRHTEHGQARACDGTSRRPHDQGTERVNVRTVGSPDVFVCFYMNDDLFKFKIIIYYILSLFFVVCFDAYCMNKSGLIVRNDVITLLRKAILKPSTEDDPDDFMRDLVDMTIRKLVNMLFMLYVLTKICYRIIYLCI